MVVKNSALANQSLSASLQKLANSSLPVKIAFSIRRLFNVLQEPSKQLEDARSVIVKRYGEADDKGNVTVKPENVSEFSEKYRELLDVDLRVEFEKVTVKLSDFDGTERLTAADIENVKEFIEITE